MYRMHIVLFRIILGAFLYAFVSLPSFALAQTSSTSSQALTQAMSSSSQLYENALNQLFQAQQQSLSQSSFAGQSTVSNYLNVKIDPPIPAPKIPVTISIDSDLTDLYKASIKWLVNGKVLASGVGKTAFTFLNGSSGNTTTVSVNILTNTGESVTKDFSFTPVGVTVMWEADTYVPPFYKGKALPSPEARMRIIAITDSAGAGNFVYSWGKDNYSDALASGYAKNVYSFTGSKPLVTNKITLDVSTLSNSAESQMDIFLPQVRPFILFYEKDPLLGVLYNKPFGVETTLNKAEFSLSAEPYYFSNEATEGATSPTINYVWSINGSSVSNYGRTITLRNDTGAKGSSLVSLAMRGLIRTFQTANQGLKVNFDEVPTVHPTF